MFLDICGFSRMMEQNEDKALKVLSDLNGKISAAAGKFGGKIIKTIGDSFLLDFRTTLDAVKCGIQIQEEIVPGFKEPDGRTVQIRTGIHLGDIHFFKDDALGEGVNIASRLQSLCRPGRICISGEVYNQTANKIGQEIQSLGNVKLKNISRNIEAYEIITGPETAGPQEVPPHHHTPNEEPIDFNELKDLVIDQIKYAGRRIREERLKNSVPERFREKFSDVIENLEDKGFVSRLERHDGGISYGFTKAKKLSEDEDEDSTDPFRPYQDYKRRVIRKASMQKVNFIGHIIPYLAVNGFLIFLNLRFSPGFFWAAFPICGWGIGILNHIAQIGVKNKEKNDVERLPELKKTEYKLLRKIHSINEKLSSHFASTAGVAILLSTVYSLTTPGGFFWPVFPIGAMLIGFLSNFARSSTELRVLRREFRERVFGDPGSDFIFGKRGKRGERGAQAYQAGESSDIVSQAITLRETIIRQMKGMKESDVPIGEDMLPILDNYVEQIRELAQKNHDLDRILQEVPIKDLGSDKDKLQKKLEDSKSEYLRNEYQKSISEIDKQVASFAELKDQKEVINLRLLSAVNSLKQMQLDLARMSTLSTSGEGASIQMLREKSEELSEYLKDLKESYEEIDDDTAETSE